MARLSFVPGLIGCLVGALALFWAYGRTYHDNVDAEDGASPSVEAAGAAGSVLDSSPEHAPRPTTSARTTPLHAIARTATV